MKGMPFILVSIVSALAGIFFGAKSVVQRAGVEGKQISQIEATQPNFVAPDIIVYPLQEGNTLGGYLVVRFVLALAAEEKMESAYPDETLLADALYTSMFSIRSTGSGSDMLPPLEILTSEMIKTANLNAGYSRYEGVLFQQFDYFEPNTIRRKNVHERFNKVEPELIKPKTTH